MVVCALVYYAGLRLDEARAPRIERCWPLTAGQWNVADIDETTRDAAPFYYLTRAERLGTLKTDARTMSLHPVLVNIILADIIDCCTGVIAAEKNRGPVDQRRLN